MNNLMVNDEQLETLRYFVDRRISDNLSIIKGGFDSKDWRAYKTGLRVENAKLRKLQRIVGAPHD